MAKPDGPQTLERVDNITFVEAPEAPTAPQPTKHEIERMSTDGSKHPAIELTEADVDVLDRAWSGGLRLKSRVEVF